MTRASQSIAIPPDAPCASTAVTSPPGQAFAAIFSKIFVLHLVSYKNSMLGFSCISIFFNSFPFLGLFSPLIFHDMSLIEKDGGST